MSSAIDPELVAVTFLAPLTTMPVAALSTEPNAANLPICILEVLAVDTPTDAPHGAMWVLTFQTTILAATAGQAFRLAGELQDALLGAASEDASTVAAGLLISSAEVLEHPLRTSTTKAASTVVAQYEITAATI